MSNKTFNARNNKAKKGISPVIATVILVAVAVVIAAALAGFSSSLFGTYSSAGAAVTVKSVTVDTTGAGQVELINSGNIADELVSMQVVGHDPATITAVAPGTLQVPANNVPMQATFTGLANTGGQAGTFQDGQNITVKMILKSGIQLTQSVIVNP
jgi:flagellin-like protein